jgi:hypothetical protein
MATAGTSSITLPPLGLPLREALELHCPFWPKHKQYEMMRIRVSAGAIRALSNAEKRQFIVEAQAAWTRVLAWLGDMLDEKNRTWELEASETLTGALKPVLPVMLRHLTIEKDFTARGPRGQLLYGLHVYSPSTKAAEPPLPVTIVDNNEPVHYRHIRAMADRAFPRGWKHLQQNVVKKGVADEFQKDGEPVPKRDMLDRALGFRKD